jgi:hypothetical protein
MARHNAQEWSIKCTARISLLVELSSELRRPEADFVRDGIYELRATYQGVHCRLLYCFAGRSIAVLSHGLTKLREVPNKEIEIAIKRKRQVAADFERYTFRPK